MKYYLSGDSNGRGGGGGGGRGVGGGEGWWWWRWRVVVVVSENLKNLKENQYFQAKTLKTLRKPMF